MIDRVQQRLHLTPQRLIGDTAYGTASILGWLVHHKGIALYMPVCDKRERTDSTFCH
jgi:hypothetical protein